MLWTRRLVERADNDDDDACNPYTLTPDDDDGLATYERAGRDLLERCLRDRVGELVWRAVFLPPAGAWLGGEGEGKQSR